MVPGEQEREMVVAFTSYLLKSWYLFEVMLKEVAPLAAIA